MTLPLYLKQALDEVNSVRHALAIGEGKLPALPKGRMQDTDECVLARALSNGWWANVNEYEINLRHKSLPGFDAKAAEETLKQLGFLDVRCRNQKENQHLSYQVVRFTPTPAMVKLISQFDAGRLPHLILKDD